MFKKSKNVGCGMKECLQRDQEFENEETCITHQYDKSEENDVGEVVPRLSEPTRLFLQIARISPYYFV